TSVLAGRLNAETIVVHPGYDENRYWKDANGFVTRAVEMWARLLELTGESGCLIALENIFERGPELLRRVVDEVGSQRFGICFDSGHFNMFSKTPLNDWMDSLGGKIVELHLHNNYGERDDHNGMASGTFDFAQLFSKLDEVGAKPILVMEPHQEDGLDESLKVLESLGVGKANNLPSSSLT
ncbi:MAG: sugar phosphate isomerase/epimerase, partial [Nitrospinae bacterium]|nr:sugar phosphate isomerase/epimerase [Nitrospinota bacterium]